VCLLTAGGDRVGSGSSYAAPLVAGAASLLWLFDRNLSASRVRTILTDPSNTRNEGIGVADPALDLLSALLALDLDAACGAVRRALVDVDDGSREGMRLWVAGNPPQRDLYTTGPDGRVDMRDFRAFRNAVLFHSSPRTRRRARGVQPLRLQR
jgi:hypothetical protein